MSAESKMLSAKRIKELGGRDATVLEHESIRVMIDDIGGMVPELSSIQGNAILNAHWNPWFRGNQLAADNIDQSFWKGNLLYHLAGNFPCAPNFGGGDLQDGTPLPPHGFTAHLPWRFIEKYSDNKTAWALSTLESPEAKMPLSFKKIDAVFAEQAVHYTSLIITNNGASDIEINAAWHNTVGAPFLQSGCIISGAANRWAVAPSGGEFDATTRLKLGAEFDSLKKAPLASGGTIDLSLVPAPLGYTDLVCGAIPASAAFGWSSLVNPFLKMAYLCFFTGAAAANDDDIILRFNDLWMQYGGRRFTPWAAYEGGTDLAYCLGTENSAAGFPCGLQDARDRKTLLGAPTTVNIPAGKTMTLRYGTLFAPYAGTSLDAGVSSIESKDNQLILKGKNGAMSFNADTTFSVLKLLE
ncbi:MAG: hypothetical protein LBV20_03030 [Treponema sp.]|jgi:hypothetical protein|nr:hypothetical protein [Treponema sp.]